MKLGSDESTLGTTLHGLFLSLAGFGESNKLFGGLLDDIGSDAVEGLSDVVEREG
jgi:hypothetical protein